MICDNCDKEASSRIGVTVSGPFICQECFRVDAVPRNISTMFAELKKLRSELRELTAAVRFLLEWMPVCSVGSSGHSRRVAVEKLLGEVKSAR